jgi:hypothetical protein
LQYTLFHQFHYTLFHYTMRIMHCIFFFLQ